VFQTQVVPVLKDKPELFPPPYNSYEHFRRAVDLTQTRAFHMVQENWVTGAAEVRALVAPLNPGVVPLNPVVVTLVGLHLQMQCKSNPESKRVKSEH
jgi:hypothetical protein